MNLLVKLKPDLSVAAGTGQARGCQRSECRGGSGQFTIVKQFTVVRLEASSQPASHSSHAQAPSPESESDAQPGRSPPGPDLLRACWACGSRQFKLNRA